MKIKGLRWWVIGLIMMITIINYLDRGTLNYMWVANVEYGLVEQFTAGRIFDLFDVYVQCTRKRRKLLVVGQRIECAIDTNRYAFFHRR